MVMIVSKHPAAPAEAVAIESAGGPKIPMKYGAPGTRSASPPER